MSIIICNDWSVTSNDSGVISVSFYDTTRHVKYQTGGTKSVTPTVSDNRHKAPKPVTMHHHTVELNKKSISRSAQFEGYQANPKNNSSCVIILSLCRRIREQSSEPTPAPVQPVSEDDEIVTKKTKLSNFLQEQEEVEITLGLIEPPPKPEEPIPSEQVTEQPQETPQ